MKVLALLAPGFEETEAIGTIDILRRATIQVDIASIGALDVTGSHGITIKADKEWMDTHSYDALFIPGGQPGVTNLLNDARVIDLVQTYHTEGKLIGAICAGPLVLEKADILSGKNITSYPMQNREEHFKNAIYHESNVVRDGNLLTSRGVGTVLEFGFAFIEALGLDSTGIQTSTLFRR